MTKRTRPKWRCCPSWHELQRLFPAQEDHLNAEAVYTLPPALLDAIVREVPGFFTAEELAFEKALHKVAGAGFFRGSPINLQLLGSPQSTETADERELRQKVEAATETIEDMLFKDLSATQRADREAAAEAIKAKLQERRWGYAGWLITSPEFRTDVEKLRTEWGSEIRHIEITEQHPQNLALIGGKGPGIEFQMFVGVPKLGKVVEGIEASPRIHIESIEDSV